MRFISQYNNFYHGLRLSAILIAMVWCLFFTAGRSAAQSVHEDQIKSVFLYNLTHFVTWPESVVLSSRTFNIGVYGNSSFQDVLEQTVVTETKQNRQLVVTKLGDLDDITDQCRIVFITKEAMGDWDKIRERVVGLPILTVADQKEFTRRGGMVSLLRQNKKIQIEVNYTTVQQAGLTMSAKLLRLARVVE
ncbi:MAG: hypothetical protein ACI8ZB_000296 [Desulforhopalus sp.]|jgi:hypothetical protein